MEVLRHCLPPSVRQTLNELPETLDETYERVLKELKKPNQVHALRLLQCLVVAIRPLQVEELVEVLAVDFGDEEGIPKLNPNWRWADEEQALLASCSSLIVIVKSHRSRVVQFSHFSVKEYLTSDRLATSSRNMSRYHIDLQPAHIILAQACLSVLLRSDDPVEKGGVGNSSPLAQYAAEHWVAHAQDEKVSSCLRNAMEYLFDVDRPYFATWLKLHDIDTGAPPGSTFYQFTATSKSGANRLYYAALCGFQDLVKHLVANNPTWVNTAGGYYETPLVAALAGSHFGTAIYLCDNGANANVRGSKRLTPLHSAASHGEFEMVQVLLKCKADVRARNSDGETPLHFAYRQDPDQARSLFDITRLLLKYGASVKTRNNIKYTPLHFVARHGSVKHIRMLLEHGADVNARETYGSSPLHEAIRYGRVEAIRVLLEHGADVYALNNGDTTPLHHAASLGRVEAIRLLLEHGADVNKRTCYDITPLHEAAQSEYVEAIRVLVELGADVNARKNGDTTPLHLAMLAGCVETVRVLAELGADVNARLNDDTTPLHLAAEYGRVEAIRVLFEHGADVNARKNDGSTPLHRAARCGCAKAIRVLVELGAEY